MIKIYIIYLTFIIIHNGSINFQGVCEVGLAALGCEAREVVNIKTEDKREKSQVVL